MTLLRYGRETKGQKKEVYSGFPLFNVIYQNDTLMEQYHAYMEECSKVVLLGGTVTSTGKTYDPGYFYSFIERMQENLYVGEVDSLNYLVITKTTETDASSEEDETGGRENEETETIATENTESFAFLPVILAFSAVVVVLLVLALAFSKRGEKK